MTKKPSGPSPDRLQPVDGLRGIAILMVLVYHFFSGFPGAYPYGTLFYDLFELGASGVYLFFVISGFVIALTLEKNPTPFEFLRRRVVRLWPPMAICSLLTFGVMHAIDTEFTQTHRQGWLAFLPALTFTAPDLWRNVLGNVAWIDPSYWTLFVEVRFYLLAAVVYMFANAQFATVFSRIAVLIMGITIVVLPYESGAIWMLLFFPEFLPFFMVGVLFFDLWRGKTGFVTQIALLYFVVLSAILMRDKYDTLLAVGIWAVFVGAFAALVFRPRLMAIFAAPLLVWVGRRSYSLYLLHQFIGIALLSLIPTDTNPVLQVLGFCAVVGSVFALSHIVYETVERRYASKPTPKTNRFEVANTGR